jgi:hypothetical protein
MATGAPSTAANAKSPSSDVKSDSGLNSPKTPNVAPDATKESAPPKTDVLPKNPDSSNGNPPVAPVPTDQKEKEAVLTPVGTAETPNVAADATEASSKSAPSKTDVPPKIPESKDNPPTAPQVAPVDKDQKEKEAVLTPVGTAKTSNVVAPDATKASSKSAPSKRDVPPKGSESSKGKPPTGPVIKAKKEEAVLTPVAIIRSVSTLSV